ncbi:MAG: hypothetical protein H0V67_06525 [Geodermatophilaceae bacterium]|nr:hypothetical protein [Geodermatophilaceae bacterium]
MFFLMALIVTVVLLVVLWRIIGPDEARPGSSARPRMQRRPRAPRRRQQLPPDDNPDFLRDLDRRARPEE